MTLKLYKAKTKGELLKHLDQVFSAESYEDFRDELVSIAEGKTDFQWEGVNRTLTDDRIHLSLHWSVVPGYEHTLSRVIVSIVDITERKRAEEALQDSEQRYRRLVESSPDAIIVHVEGRVVFVNLAALALMAAHHPAELIGQPVINFVHPDYRAIVLKRFEQTATGFENPPLEEKFIRLDGTVIDVEVTAIPFVYQGQPGTQVIVRDITERKRLDLALRGKVETLQALAEIDREIIAANEPQAILDLVCRRAAELVHAPKSAIATTDASTELELTAGYGLSDPHSVGAEFKHMMQSGLMQPMVLAAPSVMILSDISSSDERMPEFRLADDIRSVAVVPLSAEGQATGALAIFDIMPREWTADEIEVLGMLAGQAAIAVKNARLFEETNQRAERLGLLNRITHAVSATLELNDLLEIVYQEVTAVINADVFLVALYNDLTNEMDFRIRVDRGVREPLERRPLRTGMSGLIITTKKPVLVRDFEQEKDQLPPVSLWGTMEAPRSWLGVPMLLGDRVIGVISVQNYRPNTFGEEDQGLLSTIADAVAIAVENARLYAIQERRAARSADMVKLGIELATLRDQSDILNTLVKRTAELAQGAACSVMMMDEQKQELIQAAQINVPEGPPLGLRVPLESLPTIQAMLRTGEPIILTDMDRVELSIRIGLVRSDVRAFFAYPMLRPERPIGYVTLSYLAPYTPSSEEIATYQLLADRAATAIENARLFETERELRAFAEALRDTAAALNSTLNFEELLDQILANVGRVVPHDAASIMVVEDGVARVVRSRGLIERGTNDDIARLRIMVAEVDNLRRMNETGRAVVIEDTRTMPGWAERSGTDWIASNVGVPILVEDRAIGFVTLDSALPGFFTPVHANRLQAFADQAAIALQNAQLLTETQHRAEQFELLYEAGLTLNRMLESRPQFEALFNIVMKALDADRVEYFRSDPVRRQVHFELGIGYSDEQLQKNLERLNFASDDDQILINWVSRNHAPLYLANVLADPRWIPVDPDIRSGLWVPIEYEHESLGILGVLATRENAFSPQDQRLLILFANQAAVALENAKLLTETEHRAEEFLQLYETARELSSLQEVMTVLTLIVDRARSLLQAASGFVYLYDSARRELELSVENDLRVPVGVRLQLGQGMAGRVAQSRQPLLIDDYQTWEGRTDQFATVPYRAVIEVPMLYGGELIGVLGVNEFDPSTRRYTEADMRLLSLFANQASGAVQNARLFEAERIQRQRLDILYRAGQAINSSLDAALILDRLTDQAMRITHATHGSVLVAQHDLGRFERRSLRGYSYQLAEKAQSAQLPLEGGVNGRAFQTGQVIYVPDVQQDPGYFPLIPQTRSELAVPILQNGRVIGNLDLQSPEPDAFHDVDLTFLKALTDQVAVAIDKARLFAEVRQYAVELEDRVAERTRELTAANLRLTELDRLKDQFVSTVSHEFRTPLTTILSSTEMLENYWPRWTEERKRQHLARIESTAKHMTNLLDDILTIGKAEANKVEFMPAPLDLVKFCSEMVEELQLAAGREHTLLLKSEIECADACMDANLLRHILSNILSNAVKYSPRGSQIEIMLTCDGSEATIEISDHGMGIPADDQARLFETFHRGSNARNIQGTGLGMAIIKRSVDLHGGTIHVDSQVDVGTTVTVKLPLGTALLDKEIQ